MLESLFNEVPGLQDRFYFSLAKTSKNFINFLINYVLLRNVKCKVILTEVNLEPSFFTLVKPYFENVLDQISFRFHFLRNSTFHEKTYNSENFRTKSLLTREHFFRNWKLRSGMASSIKKIF